MNNMNEKLNFVSKIIGMVVMVSAAPLIVGALGFLAYCVVVYSDTNIAHFSNWREFFMYMGGSGAYMVMGYVLLHDNNILVRLVMPKSSQGAGSNPAPDDERAANTPKSDYSNYAERKKYLY